jgi:hypothetical protein
MRAGKARVEGQRALRATDCVVELEAVVMNHAEIVMAMRVAGTERDRFATGGQCVVGSAYCPINLADVTMIERCLRRSCDRMLH